MDSHYLFIGLILFALFGLLLGLYIHRDKDK
ncbi:hypothetical protein AVENLUH5627_02105 [Acinetobacter venetianus]|uniref:Uncharacterized protein n=1 Tax=Acinetobacter venetianus TaxID=52133 RepID=A0A150HMY9_9GAMM|nr:hypothetical protein AVENLUH5627_02105 [Acinetobacter venetianus]